MDLFDRIYRLHRLLRQARCPVSRATLQDKLECSRATVNRIIREMRDYLGAPIEYDRGARGYRYAQTGEHPYELPGLWFNASELHALLVCQQLLANVQPGLLDEPLAPLRGRIVQILASKHMHSGEVGHRIRILSMAARHQAGEYFGTVANTLLERKRLHIRYHGRARNEITERELSPQRLAHYRDNWYLDAWDHGKRALRSFAVDRILGAKVLDAPAKDVPDAKLDAHFAGAYGIFAGKPKHKAVLRFTAERARWVAGEQWHPQQTTRMDGDAYVLEIPYSDPRELIMDVLKYGPDVEVVAPAALRRAVAGRLRRAVLLYGAAAAEYKEPRP